MIRRGSADRCPSSLALGCTYGSLIEVRGYSPRASRDVIYSITSGPFGIWSSALSGTTFASLASYNSPGTAMRPSCGSRVRSSLGYRPTDTRIDILLTFQPKYSDTRKLIPSQAAVVYAPRGNTPSCNNRFCCNNRFRRKCYPARP